jgi:hypothetical protein
MGPSIESLQPPDLEGLMSKLVGPRAGAAVRWTSPEARDFLAATASRFRVGHTDTPLQVSADRAIDLGGAHLNEAILATRVVSLDQDRFGGLVPPALGGGAQPSASGAMILAHRFLDAGASINRGHPVESTFPALFCMRASADGRDCEAFIFDASGARKLSGGEGYDDNSVPYRLGRWHFYPDQLYENRDTRTAVVEVVRREAETLPHQLRRGPITGSQHERVYLPRKRKKVETGGKVTSPPGTTAVEIGSRQFTATSSQLEVTKKDGIEVGDDAPFGFVLGDPTAKATCSRRSQDNCLSCCDAIAGSYVGAAIAAVGAGVASGPGLVAGIAVGLGLLAIGYVHNDVCRRSCRILYQEDSGQAAPRTKYWYLVAARYASDGTQVAYRVASDDERVKLSWSRAQVMQALWERERVRVRVPTGEQSAVSVVRNTHGGYYLRSHVDGRVTNNLKALPAF